MRGSWTQCEEAGHSVMELGSVCAQCEGDGLSVCGSWTQCKGDGLSVRELETV